MEANCSSQSQETPQWRHADRRGLTYSETHRVRQRESYRAMKLSLTSLEKILPNLQSTTRTFRCKTKQTILTEAKVYIQYLQSLIWKIGGELEKPEDTLLSYLWWDGCILNNATMILLHKMRPLPPRYLQQPNLLEEISKLENQVIESQEQEKEVKSTKKDKSKKNLKKSGSSINIKIRKVAKTFKTEAKKTKKKANATKEDKIKKNVHSENRNPAGDRLLQKLKSPSQFEIQSPPTGYRRTIIEDSPLHDADLSRAEAVSPMPWLPQIQEEMKEIFQSEPLDLSSPFRINIDHPLDLSMRKPDEDLYLDFMEEQEDQSSINLSQSSSVWATSHQQEFTEMDAGSTGCLLQAHRVSDACLSSTVTYKEIESLRQPSHFSSRI